MRRKWYIRKNIQKGVEDDESMQSEYGNKNPYAPLGVVRYLWRIVLVQYLNAQLKEQNDVGEEEGIKRI